MELSTLVRLERVRQETGLSKSSIYAHVKDGLLPRPISLGKRARAWPLSELIAVNKARIAGASDGQIRQLVVQMLAKRQLSV